MRSLVASGLLLLSSCHMQNEGVTLGERLSGSAALSAWRAAGLPEPDQDGCDVLGFRVRLADRAAFVRDCRASPESSAGCLNWASSSHFFRPRLYPLIVISPNWRSEPGIIVHELMHAYVRCSRSGPSAWDAGDSQHSDPRVWTAAGGEGSAQSRAMLLLGQP